MKTLVSPQGFEIEGTNESLQGVAYINPEIDESGIGKNGLDVEHMDETKVHWNSQETIVDERGVREFVDSRGNVCAEDDLHFIDEEAGITEPQRLFPESAKVQGPTEVQIPTKLDLGQLHDLQDLIQRGIDDLEESQASEKDYTAPDREEAKATVEVGSMVLEAIQQAMNSLR